MSWTKFSNGLCERETGGLHAPRPHLLIIAGPTAVGKSAAAVALAKRLGGEVISADSMQVYRGMDIGSAKVTQEEMEGVPHHLIDVMDPHEDYNVVRFQQMAKAAAADILSRGKLPILCGGTGFYIQAFLYDIDFTKEPERETRELVLLEQNLWKQAETEAGREALHRTLTEKDPEAAQAIPCANVKRVIRALVFCALHGKPISAHNREQEARKALACPYDARFFVLTDARPALYQRINERVDRMMEAGLLEEVRSLRDSGVSRSSTAMQGIGYKELCAYLAGESSLEETVDRIKQHSRQYAKRQLTWFRRERQVIWIDRSKTEDCVNEIIQHLW